MRKITRGSKIKREAKIINRGIRFLVFWLNILFFNPDDFKGCAGCVVFEIDVVEAGDPGAFRSADGVAVVAAVSTDINHDMTVS